MPKDLKILTPSSKNIKNIYLTPMDDGSIPISEWRRKKILNPSTGKYIYEDSKLAKNLLKSERLQLKRTCPENYKYDFKKNKCVKLTKKEITEREERKTTVKKKCPPDKIYNPLSRRCVDPFSPQGKIALKLNYEKQFLKVSY